MARMQLVFRENWPLGQEIRRPGEIVMEGECRIQNATPEKIASANRFNAIEIRVVEEKKPQEEPVPDADYCAACKTIHGGQNCPSGTKAKSRKR